MIAFCEILAGDNPNTVAFKADFKSLNLLGNVAAHIKLKTHSMSCQYFTVSNRVKADNRSSSENCDGQANFNELNLEGSSR